MREQSILCMAQQQIIFMSTMIGNQDQTRPVWEVCACDTLFATIGAVTAPIVASLSRKHACKRHIDCKHESTHTLCLPIARPPPAYGPCDRGCCWEIVEPADIRTCRSALAAPKRQTRQTTIKHTQGTTSSTTKAGRSHWPTPNIFLAGYATRQQSRS